MSEFSYVCPNCGIGFTSQLYCYECNRLSVPIKITNDPETGTLDYREYQPPPAGYEGLWWVLDDALRQAYEGKGKERHADDKPFKEQIACRNARTFGIGAPLGQAVKKCEETMRLPNVEAQIRELLGAINYIAVAIITLKEADAKQAL